MVETKITYISTNSNIKSYTAKCNRGEVTVSKPSKFSHQPKTIEIEYSKKLKGHPSKFVRFEMEESVVEKLIEVLKPMLEDDSTEKMSEKLTLEWDGRKTKVTIK